MKSALAIVLAVFLVSGTVSAQSVQYKTVPGEEIQNVDKAKRFHNAVVKRPVPITDTDREGLPEGESLQDEDTIGHLGRPVGRDIDGLFKRLRYRVIRFFLSRS